MPQIQDNEAVYDSQIAPLMDQIIAICKQHNIPVAATFQLTGDDDPRDGPMHCTTQIIPRGSSRLMLLLERVVGNVQQTGRGGTPEPRGRHL